MMFEKANKTNELLYVGEEYVVIAVKGEKYLRLLEK